MKGGYYLALAGVGLTFVNAGVKFLPRIPPSEILFFRAVISILITAPVLRVYRISPFGNNKLMLVARGIAGTFGLLLYFYTLQSMPLASAVTIQYLHPILTGFVAAIWLDERPSRAQWFLLALSFLGVVMVKGFDPNANMAVALVGVVSASLTACSFTLIRALRHQDHPMVVMLYLPLVSLVILGPYTFLNWVQPIGYEWWVIGGIGLMTQISQYWLTLAYHLDSAANISNLTYLGILYSILVGMFLFGERVPLLSLLGMGFIGLSVFISTRYVRKLPA